MWPRRLGSCARDLFKSLGEVCEHGIVVLAFSRGRRDTHWEAPRHERPNRLILKLAAMARHPLPVASFVAATWKPICFSLVMLAFAMMAVIRHRANTGSLLKKTRPRSRPKQRS
jgi:hypothetical protein